MPNDDAPRVPPGLRRRAHLVDAIADAGVPETPETPGTPEPWEPTTRTTPAGETVRQRTYWLTTDDIAAIERIRETLRVQGYEGIPPRSAVIRHAIRELDRRQRPLRRGD